jgi:tRNA threonylcarbamoyladenosine biosynthesis protein TsaE
VSSAAFRSRGPDIEIDLVNVEATEALGERIARMCRGGDLLILSGDLGAGKTTLTRGIGRALGVVGAVTSPTFVVARRHRSAPGALALIHVDAYRVASAAEVDDLDLLDDADDAITVVEWGEDRVEYLADSRVHIELVGVPDNPDHRRARVWLHGPRWSATDREALAAAIADGRTS